MEQFLKGLQAIHLAGMVHRDIKCENILVDNEFNLRIADFGYAAPSKGRNTKPNSSGLLYTRLGTAGQIAPEIEYLQAGKGYDGKQVDIFNAGIILFCMIFQRMPFTRAVNNDKYYKYIVADRTDFYWELHKRDGLKTFNISQECKSLITAMLGRQPELRPSIQEILAHPWFTKTKRYDISQIQKEFDNRKAHMELIR